MFLFTIEFFLVVAISVECYVFVSWLGTDHDDSHKIHSGAIVVFKINCDNTEGRYQLLSVENDLYLITLHKRCRQILTGHCVCT